MENNIRELRRVNHLSQEDLAHISHVSRQTINAIENDKYDPELTLAFKLAETLKTTVDELFNYQASQAKGKKTMYFGAKNISVSYGKEQVLKNISLEIEKGKTTAIIGVNGSGKSTLLRALGRLVKFDGEVIFDDAPLSNLTQRQIAQKLALLPQHNVTPSDITVYDLIALGRFPHQGLMQQRMSEADKDFIEQIMWDTETWELRAEKVASLSGGQRQRVFITMILAQDSEILLLDEPTTYLDMVHQLEILSLLKRLATKHQKTVLYVIHDLNHVARFADNIVVLKEGQISAVGAVEQVFNAEMVSDCFGLRVRVGEDAFTGQKMITGIQNV